MAKKKSKKSKDYGDDIMDVVKFGAKTTIGIGALGAISKAFKD